MGGGRVCVGRQRQRLRADAGGCFGPIAFCPVCPPHQAGPDAVIVNYRAECGAESSGCSHSSDAPDSFKAAYNFCMLKLQQLQSPMRSFHN